MTITRDMAGTRPVPLIVGFVTALALFVGVEALNWHHAFLMREAAALVAHTHEVQARRDRLRTLIVEIESKQRIYVLTGLPEFLDEFEEALLRLPQEERSLEELTHDERQKAALSELKPLMAERIAFARRAAKFRRIYGAEAAAREVATLKGKKLMDEIRARFSLMDARGDELLDERSAASRREADSIMLLGLTGTALSFALLIAVFAFMLRENRRRQRAETEVDRFFTLSLDMLCIARADGYFKRVSPAFTQTLGWSEEELLARPFLDFVHPADRADTLHVVERQVVAGEKVLQFENRYQHKDGSWRILSWKSMPQPDGLMFATARDVTERTQAEKEIQKLNDELERRVRERTAELDAQRRHIELLLNSVGEGLYGLDLDGLITFMNPAGAELLGYSVAELLGQPMHAKCHHTYADGRPFPRENCPIYAAKRDGQVHHNSDDVMWRKDGRAFAVEYTSTPMRDKEGQLSGAIVVFRDITGRRQAAAALHREQEFIKALLQNVAVGVVACDENGKLVLFNQTACEWHGMNALALSPAEWARHYDLFEADGRTPLPTDSIPLLRAFRGETIRDIGMAIAVKGQPPRFILASGTSFYDADGSVLGAVAVMHDITERKQAEEALRRQADRLRNLHNTDQAILQAVESPEAIAQTALHHLRDLLQCELASVGLFDAEKKQVRVFAAEIDDATVVQIGKDLPEGAYGDLEILRRGQMEIVDDRHGVTSPSAVSRVLQAEGARSSMNVPLRTERGLIGVLNIAWMARRTIAPEDVEIAAEVAAQIAVALEQARLLQEAKRHAAELEQRVQERTRELAAANKELEAFTYSVSHDLRAPLRAIDGFSRMLLEGYVQRLDAEGQRLLGVVCANTARMAQLIDDLLAFSRIGRKALEIGAVDMAALARSAIEDIRREKSNPALRVEMGDLPPARGDRAMLGQVFVNLIGNAVKYSGKKAAPVVEVGSSREGGETVYFVKDNGAGFDMKYAGKLFGVFQRLHHDDEFEGTGVGLALVERIVRRHGGRVWAEGKVGEGAVFRFTLAA